MPTATPNTSFAEQLMTQLKDVQSPEPISAWPPAIGWWLVAVLALLLVVGVSYGIYFWVKKKALYRAATAELKSIEQQWHTEHEAAITLAAVSALLRRAAVQAFGHTVASALTGQQWADFLDEKAGRPLFATSPIDIAAIAWQPNLTVSPEDAIALAKQWCKAAL